MAPTSLAILALLCARSAAEAPESECQCVGGACAEEQVELAEESLALTMRTELLQQEVRRFRNGVAMEEPEVVLSATSPAKTKASSPFDDAQIHQLTREQQNLTHHVHQQAADVATKSDELSRALVGAKASVEHGAELERKLSTARSEADATQQRIEGFLIALNKLKERQDELKNETAMAQQQLHNITRQYEGVTKDYKELLARLPSEQGANATANEAVRDAGQEVQEAGTVAGTAQALVRADSYELQEAIQKLNSLNADLRVIEGRLQSRYDHAAAAAPSWSPLLLLLLSFALAGQMR